MDIPSIAIHSTAIYSPCKKYRYTLERKYDDENKGIANFIMLNPSTATELFNDPTVARCEKMTLMKGLSTMVVTNIFAYRATDPKEMRAMGKHAVGVDNNMHIVDIAKRASLVVCAWGNHGTFLDRGDEIRKMLKEQGINAHCIKMSAQGHPVHPLYQKINGIFKEVA